MLVDQRVSQNSNPISAFLSSSTDHRLFFLSFCITSCFTSSLVCLICFFCSFEYLPLITTDLSEKILFFLFSLSVLHFTPILPRLPALWPSPSNKFRCSLTENILHKQNLCLGIPGNEPVTGIPEVQILRHQCQKGEGKEEIVKVP